MAQVPIFPAEVVGDSGRLVLKFDDKYARQRQNYLRRLGSGRKVEVVVRLRQTKRSDGQNRWVWGVAIPILADELGYDRDEHERLYYALIDECFGTTFDSRLGRRVANVRGSQLTTAQFSGFMEWLVRWAAREHGCVIPLPNEAQGEDDYGGGRLPEEPEAVHAGRTVPEGNQGQAADQRRRARAG